MTSYERRIPALMAALADTDPDLHDELRDDYCDVFAVIEGDEDAQAACLADSSYLMQRANELESRLPLTPELLDADPTLTEAQQAHVFDMLFEYTGDGE